MAENEVLYKTAVPKWILSIINQLYDIENKIRRDGDPSNIQRNLEKILNVLNTETGISDLSMNRIKLAFEDPMGQDFTETRTDLEATISGAGTDKLRVVEVVKPIIRVIFSDTAGEYSKIVQKGIVVVESKIEGERKHHG